MALTAQRLSASIRSMKNRLNTQAGGASLLVTVILALLLLGVVGGLTTLSVRELRQASNTEQSNRALSAAESFVEQKANEIVVAGSTAFNDACKNQSIGGAADNLAITCYTVTKGRGDSAEAVLDRDKTFRLQLDDISPAPASMSIEWHVESDGSLPGNWADYYTGAGWPTTFEGEGDVPAAIETTFVAWQKSSGNIAPNATDGDFGLPLKKYLTKPGGTSGPVKTTCSAKADEPFADGYYCKTTDELINLASATGQGAFSNLVFKITPRYSGTKVRIKLFDSTGKVITIPLPYATIDVTARANNLYRRVVATKVLDPTLAYSHLDGNVLFSGKNICKTLVVGSDYNGVNGGNGTNDANCENPPPE